MEKARERKDRRREIANDEEGEEKERGEWDRDMKREEEMTRDNRCNKRGKRF